MLSLQMIRCMVLSASSSSKACQLRRTIEEQDVAIYVLVGRRQRSMPSELQERSLEDQFSARTDLYLGSGQT